MSNIRVRIAPSPTGDPHVGTAYIALFNYAFARKQGGKFLLRIEDTDRTRSDAAHERAILDALHWLGLDWDEGPDVGGPHASYRQSERGPSYVALAQELVGRGAAYRCFQGAEALEKLRAGARAGGAASGLRSPDRALDAADAERRAAAGEPHVVRLRVPDTGVVSFRDRLRGVLEFACVEIDDQVLLKADGMPTYHLANVADDHAMLISHVFRGEEWISSTPKHVLLYAAMGWTPPEFGHLPLLRNPDRSKLSKRKNPTSITYYRDQGYLPEALLNFLGLMGYSTSQGDEKIALADFVRDFDIDKVSLGEPQWDLTKLDNLNARYLREDHTPAQLYARLRGWLLSDDYLARTVAMTQPRLVTLGDFVPLVACLLSRDVTPDVGAIAPPGLELEAARDVLATLLWTLEERGAWTHAPAQAVAEEIARRWELKIRQVTHLLFVSLTGAAVGPPVYETLELLGKDRARNRLRAVLDLAGGLSKKAEERLRKRWTELCAKPLEATRP